VGSDKKGRKKDVKNIGVRDEEEIQKIRTVNRGMRLPKGARCGMR